MPPTNTTLALTVTGKDAGAIKLLSAITAAAHNNAKAFTAAQVAAAKLAAAPAGAAKQLRDTQGRFTSAAKIEAAARAQQARDVKVIMSDLRNYNALLDEHVGRLNQTGTATQRLIGWVVKLAAAYGAGRLISGFLRTGLAINEQIENAEIGIASLINSQTQLTAAGRGTLVGAEKFEAALGVAREQMDRLRVASLKTVATTNELVEGYQANLAVGLQMGLSLDQVLDLTILITQAMSAMKIPLFQLAQETRALLTGTIDRNARLARGLRISSEQVKQAKEEGRLYEFIGEKLASFKDSGDAVAASMSGIRSALKEAFELLTRDSTRGLFESMKATMQTALTKVFDLDLGKVRPAFAGLSNLINELATELGNVFRVVFLGAIDGARRLGDWFETHKTQAREIGAQLRSVGTELFSMLATTARMAASLAKTVLQSTTLRAVLILLRDVAAVVAKHFAAVVGTVVGFVTLRAVILSVLSVMSGLAAGVKTTTIAMRTLTLFSPWAALAIVLATIATLMRRITAEREKQLRLDREAMSTETARQTEVARLSVQYATLSNQIAKATKGSTGLKEAQQQLATIARDLVKAGGPAYAKALAEGGTSAMGAAVAVNDLVNAQLRQAAAEKAAAAAALATARARLAHAEALASADEHGRDSQRATVDRAKQEIAKAENTLDAMTERYDTLFDAVVRAGEAVAGVVVAPVTGADGTDPAEAAKRVLEAVQRQNALFLREAQLTAKTEEDALTRQYAKNLVSTADYYDQLGRIRDTAIKAEQEANSRLLALPSLSAEDRASIMLSQRELDAKLAASRAAVNADRVEAVQRVQDDLTALREAAAQIQGETEAETFARIARGYKDMIDRATRANKTESLALIDRLINVGAAKDRLRQIEDAIAATRARVAAAESSVSTRLDSGAISERQGREELVDVYREQERVLADLLAQYKAIAVWAPETFDATRLQEFATELESVRQRIKQTGDDLANVRLQVREAFQSDLASFLGSAINEVHTLRDALAELARTIAASLQRIAADFVAARITGFVTDAIGKLRGIGGAADAANAGTQIGTAAAGTVATAGANAAATAAAGAAASTAFLPVATTLTAAGTSMATAMTGVAATFTAPITGLGGAAIALQGAAGALAASAAVPSVALARGGYVRGPGSTVSDSIPAWLSNREYVLNAKAVQRIGVRQLDEWNTGAQHLSPRPVRGHFASGGLAVAGRGATHTSMSSELVVRYDPGLIVSLLRSSEGQRTVLRAIERNRDAANAALGR